MKVLEMYYGQRRGCIPSNNPKEMEAYLKVQIDGETLYAQQIITDHYGSAPPMDYVMRKLRQACMQEIEKRLFGNN